MITDAVKEAAARQELEADPGTLVRLQVRIPEDIYEAVHRIARRREGTSPADIVAEGIRLVLDAAAEGGS